MKGLNLRLDVQQFKLFPNKVKQGLKEKVNEYQEFIAVQGIQLERAQD